MKIDLIYDYMVNGARQLRALDGLSETELFLVVCSAKPGGVLYRVARDMAKLFLMPERWQNLVFLRTMWTRKRLYILPEALDSTKSTELLQSLSCDVLLH